MTSTVATRHPVACHCHALGSDDTCPSRWTYDETIGATNCPRDFPHRHHAWDGTHPWRGGVSHMRCRGVTVAYWLGLAEAHVEDDVNPRWRDYHTLPDERLLRPVQRWFYKRKRVLPDGTVAYPFGVLPLVKAMARYSLRHFHCNLDGQCVFRANHRGGCCWGSEDDD